MSDSLLVQVEDLHRYYGAVHAVRAVSFTLRRGQVLGFLGPNGAGKTTTLQLLAGALAPQRGRIVINNSDLGKNPRAAKQALGYLPEQPPLYPELTVDEYLTYSARLRRLPRRTVSAAVARARERCGLGDMGRRLLGQLSQGYRQRVGIAQAIVHTPPLLILDEPTNGLDPLQMREIRALIKELGREHGIILSTHILSEVEAVCTDVQIIRQGQLVYADTLATRHHALTVGLRQPPLPTVLLTLPGVAAVETVDTGRFRLRLQPAADPAPLLVERACQEGWGLYELTPERDDLERLFVELTVGREETA